MVIIVITGDRNGYSESLIEQFVNSLPEGTTVITGGASGVDSIAHSIAKKRGLHCIREFANWQLYYRAAGPIRNSKMLDYKPDLVVAFHSNLATSKGTKNCITQAQERGIPVLVNPKTIDDYLNAKNYLKSLANLG